MLVAFGVVVVDEVVVVVVVVVAGTRISGVPFREAHVGFFFW